MELQKPLHVFYCYAREDKAFRDALDRHLSGLKRQHFLTTWSDREIGAGEEWKTSIDVHLQQAHIILCLVSPDFLASHYCYEQEMQQALKRHREGTACVIPILVRPTYWENTPLGELQMLPSDALAVVLWPHPDAAWVDIIEGILPVIQKMSSPLKTTEELFEDGDAVTSIPNFLEKAEPKRKESVPKREALSLSFARSDFQRILAPDNTSILSPSEPETEILPYSEYEAKYTKINQLLAQRQPAQALACFGDQKLQIEQLPLLLRWRTLALRGQAYFELREFSKAQRDCQSALSIMPNSVAEEHLLTVTKLYLHLAEATRELNQFEQALEYYWDALQTMDVSTPLCYVAEAHWGMSLVYYNQGHTVLIEDENGNEGQNLLQKAWQHAENGRILYSSVADDLNADLLQCQMAQMERLQGKVVHSKQRLLNVLDTWQHAQQAHGNKYASSPTQCANIISAAACYLADIECRDRDFQSALQHIDIAIKAGLESFKVRQAEAFMMKGKILEIRAASEKINVHDPAIEESYKKAIDVVKDTGRKGLLSQAHYELGRYLLNIGKKEEGNQEIGIAHRLAGIPSNFVD